MYDTWARAETPVFIGDGLGKGPSPEAVGALKAFLAVKRQEAGVRGLPDLCKSLPKDIQAMLGEFMKDLERTKYLRPNGNPKPEWKVFYGATLDDAYDAAMGEAVRIAKEQARLKAWIMPQRAEEQASFLIRHDLGGARDAALNATWRAAISAGRDAKSRWTLMSRGDVRILERGWVGERVKPHTPFDAAMEEAGHMALDAAERTLLDAASRGILRDASPDKVVINHDAAPGNFKYGLINCAVLLSSLMVVEDLDFEGKDRHMATGKALWDVWKSGYVPLCEVDGFLYVYCAGKPPASANPLKN